MDVRSSHGRPPTRRTPLGDATFRANVSKTPPRQTKPRMSSSSSGVGLPHHESLMANGPLTVRNVTCSPENKRLSAITSEDPGNDSKRNSQVSTTSTNASGKGRRRKTHIGPWLLGSDIGKGGCGKVRKVRHSITGQQAAVKIISKVVAERARAESLANLVESSKKPHAGTLASAGNVMPFGIEREVVIMKLLEHPNVVKLYDVWENRNELYLVMEYVDGGELFEYVETRESVAEDETVFLFRQIVAALLHCHRLGIHHRDLKPENILVDRDSLNIKLVDFGMAALQPVGKMLTTPCGSIHYAAPEVFEKNYDGSKVDVWSLGIILYVMLTGATPFQYEPRTMANNVSLWYSVIKSGVFPMPEELSKEAQDLIRKMLIPNPKYRITLEDVWAHPLIHKYEAEWGESPASTTIDCWIGPKPFIENWTLKEKKEIDREILRNLRTLWHSVKEDALVEKLLSQDPNQEKYFYSALQRHREEQLENYVGNTDGVAYSMSDHHHIKPVIDIQDIPPLPSNAFTTTKSSYSILNNEHIHTRNSLHEPPPSIGSYDPYRESRDHMTRDKDNYVKVSVLRNASRHSRSYSGMDESAQQPGVPRVEALKTEQHRVSQASSLASLRHSSQSQKSRTGARRSMSRSSLGSSMYQGGSPVAGGVRPNPHKRAVNFSQIRRSSSASALAGRDGTRVSPYASKHDDRKSLIRSESIAASDIAPSPSSNVLSRTVVRSRKEGLVNGKPHARSRKAQTDDEAIDNEARKVSTELEKFCEEVFFRTSVGSSNRTSATASQPAYDTPPSSISNRDSYQGSQSLGKSIITPSGSQRPLPVPPAESSTTFIARELAETRKRLAARYAETDDGNNSTYHDVLAHLDALLVPGPTALENRRAASAPGPRTTEFQSYLPIISEEGRTSEQESEKEKMNTNTLRKPSLTLEKQMLAPLNSIRMVDQSSPPQIAPLVIRKTSGSSSGSQVKSSDEAAGVRYYGGARGKLVRMLSPTSPVTFDDIAQETGRQQLGDQAVGVDPAPRKMNWFRRKLQPADAEESKRAQRWQDLDDREERPGRDTPSTKPPRSPTSESMRSLSGGLAGKRPGFLRFLTSRRKPKQEFARVSPVDADQSQSLSTGLSSSDLGASSAFTQHHTLDMNEQTDPRDLGVQRNWLSRFLNIKPATKILCFCTGRGHARQEIVRLLRSWKQFGMKDVLLDRARNLVFARLDAVNHLGIKEVSFVVEMYVMLEQGRKAKMSVCRFTQRKGAVSSFRRVVEAVENTLRSKGLLVKNAETWREMEGVLAGA